MKKAVLLYRNTSDIEKFHLKEILVATNLFEEIIEICTFEIGPDDSSFFEYTSNVLIEKISKYDNVYLFGFSFNATFILNIFENIKPEKIILFGAIYNPAFKTFLLDKVIKLGIFLSKYKIIVNLFLKFQILFINSFTVRFSNLGKIFTKQPQIYKDFKVPRENFYKFTSILKAFASNDYSKKILENDTDVIVINGNSDKLISERYSRTWESFQNVKLYMLDGGDHDIISTHKREIINILQENIK